MCGHAGWRCKNCSKRIQGLSTATATAATATAAVVAAGAKQIIVATSKIDGAYLPDSSLSLITFNSFCDLREHIKNQVKYFLEKSGYTDAMEDFSHMRIKDSKENLIYEIKKDTAISKEELKDKIVCLIDFMEESIDMKKKLQLTLSPEDDEDDSIVVRATAQRFFMYFNQAPNSNGWDQLDICITYL
jgi:hypothetical protein